MLPILFGADATSWNTFGIGVLSNAISCEVEENRNGSYELEMTYPITGAFYDDIKLRSLIVAKPNYTDDPQPFRVYMISKPIDGIVTINAQHISYDLSGFIDAPFTATGIQAALSQIVNSTTIYPTSCPFTFASDMSGTQTMKLKHPESVRALLGGIEGSLIDIFGGEWHFDGYSCVLNAARGANRGVIIHYGKNLTDLRQEELNESVYTGVYPYYYESDANILVTLPEKVINASGTFNYTRILPLDLTSEFEEEPSQSDLRTRAQSYVTSNNIGVPKVNLTVGFVELDSFQERVDLCDTVSVRFDALGVSATAKCIRTKWDVLKERYIEAEFGSAKRSLAETIADTSEIIRAIKEHSSQFAFVADKVANRVTGNKGGFISLHDTNNDGEPDEILIMDNADINQAVKIIRMNNAGIAFSKTGYNGAYSTAWNIDGEFVADFIASGTLMTDNVKIFGDAQFNWDGANITMTDPTDSNRIIRFGKYNGTDYGLGFSVDGGSTWKSGFTFEGIKLIGDVNNTGRAEMDGDSFDIINENGVSIAHIGIGTVIDTSGNVVQDTYNRLGTFQSHEGSTIVHGIYSFSAGRRNVPLGPYSIAIGYESKALKYGAIAIGEKNVTNGYGITIGLKCVSNGNVYQDSRYEGSVAIGHSSEAQYGCVAIGTRCTTQDSWDMAIGYQCSSSSGKAICIGCMSSALGYASVVIGTWNHGDIDNAIAIGMNHTVSGEKSSAIGYYNQISGESSSAIGEGNTVTEDYAFVAGRENEVSGYAATVIGYRLKSSCNYQVLFGRYNSPINNLLVVGNGDSDTNRSNALRLATNGNMWIAGSLTQGSDERLKDIVGEPPDLSEIRAVLYKWNDSVVNHDEIFHIGYTAQSVEKVAPYLVYEDEKGLKSLDYIALLCAKVERLERTVERMSKRIEELEGRMA